MVGPLPPLKLLKLQHEWSANAAVADDSLAYRKNESSCGMSSDREKTVL